MRSSSPSVSHEAFRSSAQRLLSLLPGAAGLAFLGPDGALLWSSFENAELDDELLSRARTSLASENRKAWIIDTTRLLMTVPVLRGKASVAALLAPFAPKTGESMDHAADRTWRRLRPLLDDLGRQLGPPGEQPMPIVVPAEHTEQLEWLLALAAEVHVKFDRPVALEQLLAATVRRMNASFGALTTPDRQPAYTYNSPVLDDGGSALGYRQAHPYLMSYLQRRVAPLLANRPPNAIPNQHTCKIMAVPITRRIDNQVGMLALCKPASLPDFCRSELYLTQHIALLIETLLDRRHDSATGLLTRLALEQDAGHIISTHGTEESHSVLYIDIDHLHVLNETFGFDFGDQAIARIAKLLRPPCLPGNAISGRVAGDRFVALMPGCDTARAQQLTQSLQREVNKLTVGLHPQRITLSVSCGIASVPAVPAGFSRAMSAAELACRSAKERGRSRSEVYLDVDDSMMHRKGDILGVVRLRAALDNDRLKIFAQRIAPIRDLTRTSGVECLARLVAEDGTIVAPSDFLSAASRYQLSRAMDEWMIKHTLEALQPHASMLFHGEIQIALNISEQSLRDDDFLRYVEDRVGRSDVAPGLITFEIDESTAARDVTRTNVVIRFLRRLGCKIAIDEFGAATSSLAHMRGLRPNQVKMGSDVVRDVLTNADCEANIRAIVELGAAYDVDCVAKHIESDAVVRKLRELGVHHVQGHGLHAAEPLTTLVEALRDEESRQLERLYQQY